MVYLSLTVLGPFQAWTAKGALPAFRTLKERGLLAYLATERGRPHARDALAELFWPERPEGAARNNLRQALFGLRQALGEAAFDAIFAITAADVQFNLSDQVWFDGAAFDMHIQAARLHTHPANTPCFHCIQHLANAVDLYRGDFLQDVQLDDNQEFQDWQAICREQYFQRQVQALDYLVDAYEQMGEYGQAAVYALRQVQLDDLKESAYRRLMRLLARNGRYSSALEQFELCKRKLGEVLGIEPDRETQRLADQIRAGVFAGQEEADSPVVHNLPEQLTPFVGREMELARIAHAIESPGTRLLTITGPGGVGKTRLAIQALLSNLRRFSDGVFFVPLESLHSPDHLAEAIGQVVGLVSGRQPDFRAALLDHLRTRSMLLGLDNFEHLLEGKDLLLEMLRAAPGLKILVTSRERLHFQAEQVIPLHGLSFPVTAGGDDGSLDDRPAQAMAGLPPVAQTTQAPDALDGLKPHQFEAVQLFLERAGRTSGEWAAKRHAAPRMPVPAWPAGVQPRAEDLEAVIRICRAVDGLPLAIELAASWARDFSLAQIAGEVQHSLDFLQASLEDLPERHRSLRASFEHSWELLTENEREIFCRLAVFPGSFSVSAAQAVAGAALPWLIALEDKSLIRRVGLGRYGLHALLRQFAGQKLRQLGAAEAEARRKHALFFCGFLKDRENDLKGLRQAEALDEVEAELENIQAAWDWAVQHHDVQLFELAGFSLMLFMEFLSRWREGEAIFAAAVESLEQRVQQPEEKHVLAYLMIFQGWFNCRLSRFDQALARIQAGMQLLEGAQASNEKSFAHFALGFLCVWMNRFEEAWSHLSTSLSTSLQAGNEWGVGWARQVLNEIAFESRKIGLQEGPFLETLALFDRLGEIRGSSRALNYLGNIAIAQERYYEARSYFEKMTANLEKIGDVWGAASGYQKLGQVAASMGDLTRAWSLYQLGLEMLRKTGDQRRTAIAIAELGELSVQLGRLEQAEGYFREAFETASLTRSLPLAQELLTRAAASLARCQQVERAAAILNAVLAHPLGDQLTMNRASRLLAQMQEQQSAPPVSAPDGQGAEARIWQQVDDLLKHGLGAVPTA